LPEAIAQLCAYRAARLRFQRESIPVQMMPSCDQTGVPIHFHSSTTSGSASLMSLRILPRVSPRQSPSSAILFEMSSDADSPCLAPDSFSSHPRIEDPDIFHLQDGDTGILDALGRQFERALIVKALARTGGRRIDAANLLGMGRNTITRKIQELGIEDSDDQS
jgi:hypothetical protein